MTMAKCLRAVLVVVPLLMLAGPAIAQGPPPAKVVVEAAVQEVVELRREVLGNVRAAAIASVAAKQEGKVLELAVEVGERLERGAVLARLDTTILELELNREKAELVGARASIEVEKAELERARREIRRLESLRELGGAMVKELDDAQSDLDSATARLARAEAELATQEQDVELVEQRLEDMVIRSPFGGVVTQKLTEVGEWVSAGDAVVEVVRLDVMDVYINVPEGLVGALLKEGASVSIRVDAVGEVVSSVDFAVIPQGNELARTFPVRVRIVNESGRMQPGMSVVASVPTGQSGEMVTISKDAMLRSDTGPYVYVAVGAPGEQSAAPMPISIRFAVGDRIAIAPGGVQAGALTLVEGNERVFPTQPLILLRTRKPGEAEEAPGLAEAGPAAVEGGAGVSGGSR